MSPCALDRRAVILGAMNELHAHHAAMRELAARANDGIEVVLLWNRCTSELMVEVRDAGSGDEFVLTVDPAHALDAFHHPFAYAASRGVAYAAAAA